MFIKVEIFLTNQKLRSSNFKNGEVQMRIKIRIFSLLKE